jgi:hypothetical protein
VKEPDALFAGLAEFEVRFFTDLIRSYAKLDLGMRGFFYHRIKQVVKEAIDLLRAQRAAAPPGSDDDARN